MRSRFKFFGAAFLLALGLGILPSCVGSEETKSTGSSGGKATAIAQPVSQNTITQVPSSLRFAPPIDCTLGKDCFVLLYPDRDPSPAAVDFGCGRQTYDGHTGTDFAIPDEQTMQQGVAVVASAPGRVLRVRDGVADRRVESDTDKAAIEGIECGNGVVIDHSTTANGQGWETQYCHLRNGSVQVKPGDKVETGTVLGMVGASGLASFPHVHLNVRYQGEIVDPFVGVNAEAGCQISRNPIWNQNLTYVPTGLIRAGFSTQPPNMEQLWEGDFAETTLSVGSPALLFWVQAYGVMQGDRVDYRLIDPQGQTVVEHSEQLKTSNRTWLGYAGKKNSPERPLTPGVWKAEYRLKRGDKILINIQRDVNLQ